MAKRMALAALRSALDELGEDKEGTKAVLVERLVAAQAAAAAGEAEGSGKDGEEEEERRRRTRRRLHGLWRCAMSFELSRRL